VVVGLHVVEIWPDALLSSPLSLLVHQNEWRIFAMQTMDIVFIENFSFSPWKFVCG